MEFTLVLIIAAVVVGLSKGGMGAVLGVLVAPLLAMVMPTQDAISLALPMLIVGDVFSLQTFWKTWDMRYIRLLLPLGIVGILIGTFLLKTLDAGTLRHILGFFTLLFVVYKLADKRLKSLDYQPRGWHGYAAGLASGLGSALANAGAVPFTAFMLLQDISPLAFAGTTTLFFAVLNLLRVPLFLWTGLLDFNRLLNVVWALPFIPLGVYAGRWMINWIDKAVFENIMLTVLVVAAAVLLFM